MEIWSGVTDAWQTTEYRATQLLFSIQFKLSHAMLFLRIPDRNPKKCFGQSFEIKLLKSNHSGGMAQYRISILYTDKAAAADYEYVKVLHWRMPCTLDIVPTFYDCNVKASMKMMSKSRSVLSCNHRGAAAARGKTGSHDPTDRRIRGTLAIRWKTAEIKEKANLDSCCSDWKQADKI